MRQLFNYIPPHLVPQVARDTGVDEQARTFSPWSQVVARGDAQLTPSSGLNDVGDARQLNSGPLSALRGASPPRRNNRSHANKVRGAVMAGQLFWAVLDRWGEVSPRFGSGQAGKRLRRRLKRKIHPVDSTTIQPIASGMDWAKHRRRKAAAKCQVRLDLQSFLPRFAIVDTARPADAKRARELGAGIREGAIAILDKAYVDFGHLWELAAREVIGGTRAKENLQDTVVGEYAVPAAGKIVADEGIGLTTPVSQAKSPEVRRRMVAWGEVDGAERLMEFLTNQLTWSPETVVELYRCRWPIEGFFKQIKQTLQLADLLGTSANAVRWQIWTARPIDRRLRQVAFLTQWAHSFSRLFALVRTGLWRQWDLLGLLARYGTAGGSFRYPAHPEQAYFPGFP